MYNNHMSHVTQLSCIPHITSSAGAPSAHKQSQLCCVKQSQFYCVKQSQLCCVKLHEQPFRARACLLVQARPARL